MNHDTVTCDRCDAMILDEPWGKMRYSFPERTEEDGLYSRVEVLLCEECEYGLLDYVNQDVDNSDKVDMPNKVRSGAYLKQLANDLTEMGDAMSEELNEN